MMRNIILCGGINMDKEIDNSNNQMALIEIDEPSFKGFVKEIGIKNISYFLQNQESFKRLGIFNKEKMCYFSHRNRYMKELPGQKEGFPNWNRPNRKKGHYYDKFKAYGISEFLVTPRNEEDLFIVIEEQLDNNKIRFLVCDFGAVKKCGTIVDYSNGVRDLQYIVPEKSFNVVEERDFHNLKLEVKSK